MSKNVISVSDSLDWYAAIEARHIDEVKLELALELDRAAKSLGMLKKDVAERMGTSGAWISKVLRGDANPTLDTLQTLAQAVDCNVHVHFAPKDAKVVWTEVLPRPEIQIHFSVNSGLVNHARVLMNPSVIGGLLNSHTEYLPTPPSIEPLPISHNALQAERP
ncbi:helix-turn-helix domain-containing protein [Paraburkholderia guartelaensis]|uniref:helix-turn-helix domain-containing protein n=1 Tax=Paraburkholderia guartelaensis TaxID=2546446 RepID=UPI002AB73409|nr:helix-turn-helix transcriptional regulator [Paraburkholderia guartelaensis]